MPQKRNQFFSGPIFGIFLKILYRFSNVLGLGTHPTRRALKNAADPIYECSKRSCERQAMTICVQKAIVSLRSVPSRGFSFSEKNVFETKTLSLGVAFLAGALFSQKNVF